MAISVNTTLCLLLVVALGSAAPAQEKSSSSCCWPKVFESKIGISVGQVSPVAAASQTMLVDGTIHADWDKNMKVAIIEHIYNSDFSLDLKIIEDLKAKVMYTIMVAEQTCTKIPLPEFSTTMTKKGTQKLGLGTESLDVDVYEANNTDIIIKTYITQTQCLPVVQTLLAPFRGSKQAQGQVFSDLSLSIKDPSVFTIPDYCHKNAEPMVVNQVVKDAVLRHRASRSLWAEATRCLLIV